MNGLREAIERVKKSSFFTNTGWMIGERIYQMVISLIVGMLTARFLGPSNYGIINYVAAFVSFATPICGLGLEGVIVKKYVDDQEKAGKYIGTAIVMEFFVSAVSTGVIVFVVGISNAGDSIKMCVAFLASLSLLFKSTEPIEFWYQSKLKSKYTSIIKMIAYTCMSIYRIVLLILQKSVVWFAFSTSLDMLIIGILYYVLYHKQKNPKLSFDFNVGKQLLQESYHFILSSLIVVVYSQMDKIMLQHFEGEVAVGLYSAAYTICNLWFFVPNALIMSARPIILRAKENDEKNYFLKLKQLYAAVFWLGVVVATFFSLTASEVIRLLYGNEYLGATGALVIGIWYGIFALLGSARGIWVLAENKNRYVKLYLLWGAVINCILNYFMIQKWGASGAALATLITQFFTCVVAPLLYKETRVHTKILLQAIMLKWRKGI